MNVAILPNEIPALLDAVLQGGAKPTAATDADAIIWTDTSDPEGLAAALKESPARWVQLPFAGIERFVASGVVDASRTWTCAKGIYGPATAEQALALMLAAARKYHVHLRTREWVPGSDERRLEGTTAVVVGMGGIGRSLGSYLEPLGVRVIGVSRTGPARVIDVAGEADWLVIAAAHTPATHHMINADVLVKMKPDAWLVNVARGPLVDTSALLEALDRIGGAALDVTDPEPLPADHPLWTRENVIITSHTANTFAMAVPELAAQVRRNVEHFIRGEELEGLVNPEVGY